MSRIKAFAYGVRHIFWGFSFLAKNPRLWPFAILPTVINLLLLILLLTFFLHYYSDDWLEAYSGPQKLQSSTWLTYLLATFLSFLDLFFELIIILMSLFLILILTYALGLVIASPFNDALSEKTEEIATGHPAPPFSLKKFLKDMIRIVGIELAKTFCLLLIPFILFILNIIPVLGSIVYASLTFLFGALSVGFSYTDLPASRKVTPFKERVAFARRHLWSLIGLGMIFLIPFFSLLFAAPMVVGGTLLSLHLSAEEEKR